MTVENARPRYIVLALLAGAVVLAAGCVAQFLAWQTAWFRLEQLYAGIVAVLIVAAARPLVDRLATRIEPTVGPGVVWSGVVAGSAGLGLALAMHFAHVFTSSYRFLRPYGSFWEMEPETFLAPLAATIVAGILGFRAHREVPTSPLAPRRAGIATLGVAVILAAFATIRALHTPTLQAFERSLPLVGAASPVRGREGPLPTQMDDGGLSARYLDERVGPYVLRRFLFEAGWHTVPLLGRTAASLPERIDRSGRAIVPTDGLELRRDERHRLLVLGTGHGDYAPGPAVFDADTLEPRSDFSLSNALVADSISLPLSWIAGLWVIVAVAAWAMFRPVRATYWLSERTRWRTGTLRADHMVQPDDGSAPIPAPTDAASLAPGAVVWIDRAVDNAGAPFRDRAARTIATRDFTHGDATSLDRTLRAEHGTDARYAFALATAAAAILLAAASVGIVV